MKPIDWKMVRFILITVILGELLIIALIIGERLISFFILIIEVLNVLHTYQNDKLVKPPEELSKIGIGSRANDISPNNFSAMVDQVEKYAKQRNFQAALRYGSLSRPLYLDGQYEERIRLGETIFQVGSAVGNKEVQAQALIDDLGWTYVMLNNCDEAKKNINHGLKIAEEIKDYYWIAKANRHLGGISEKFYMFPDAEKNLLVAREVANKITDEKHRTEMLAGIQFGLAGVYRDMGKLKEAEIACKSAQKAYKDMNDRERLAKTYALLGKIYLDNGLNREALSTFSEGLEVSSRLAGRKDEIVRNLIGIARVHLIELKTRDAKGNLEEAKNIAESIGLAVERDEAKNLLQKIK